MACIHHTTTDISPLKVAATRTLIRTWIFRFLQVLQPLDFPATPTISVNHEIPNVDLDLCSHKGRPVSTV